MNYCVVPVAIALLANLACRRDNASQRRSASGESSLASTISTADPRTSAQLTKGFYGLDNNSWRWTEKNFAVTLAPPRGAAQKGALLVLRFTLPPVLLQTLKSITVSAAIRGFSLPPQRFAEAGEHLYSQRIASEYLRESALQIDFSLDRTLPPTVADSRELGIIVSEIGLEIE